MEIEESSTATVDYPRQESNILIIASDLPNEDATGSPRPNPLASNVSALDDRGNLPCLPL